MHFDCLSCPKIGKTCRPNPLGLPANELWEWTKQLKTLLNLSNTKVSDMSGVPVGTVSRFFAGDHADFKLETARRIISGMLGGLDSHPCPASSQDDKDAIQKLENDNKRLRAKHKRERKLFITLFIVVGVIAILALGVLSYFLIYDFMHPGSGIVIW